MRKIIMEADISGYYIDDSLLQYDEKSQFRLIAYLFKKISFAEYNYEIHDKELFAIVHYIQKGCSELISLEKFIILINHKNLEYFMKKQKLNEKQVRGIEDLISLSSFTTRYRPEKLSRRPDILSCKEEDMFQNIKDECIEICEIQFFRDEWFPSSAVKMTPVYIQSNSRPVLSEDRISSLRVFEKTVLQELWKEALRIDQDYHLIVDAIKDQNITYFPSYLHLISLV